MVSEKVVDVTGRGRWRSVGEYDVVEEIQGCHAQHSGVGCELRRSSNHMKRLAILFHQ